MNRKVLFLLKDLEKDSKKFWNISPETGLFLNLLIKDRKYKTILEIGTSNGYSGIWLAEALSTTKGHLYTIESNKKIRYPLALENFKKSGLEKFITPILGHAPEAIPSKPKFFELAFFDATKEEHSQYFEKICKRIKKGGMIITDNLNSHRKELKPYIQKISKDKKWESHELNIGSGLLISVLKNKKVNL